MLGLHAVQSSAVEVFHALNVLLLACLLTASSAVYMLYDVCVHREEANEYIEIGALNGLFVLGRSIGFIGKHNELLYLEL